MRPRVVEPVLAGASLVLVLAAGLGARRALRVARTLRAIASLVVVPLAEAGPGFCLVRGRIQTAQPLRSPFHGRPCAYYAYRVEELSPGRGRPRRLAVGKEWADLAIQDATGWATIDARPALIQSPHTTVTNLEGIRQIPEAHREFFQTAGIEERHLPRFHGLRVTELTLEPGDEVHVLGTVALRANEKVFYRNRHSPLAVSAASDAGLLPGLRNERLLFSVAAALLGAFALLFLAMAFV